LCFIISYSGNTAETIELYKKAKTKRCKIVIITSGGRLVLGNEDRVLVEKGYQPREAFVWLLFPVLNILKINYKECFKIIKKFDLYECKKIARKLENKVPIVYCSSESFRFLGYRWQTFFNENSKILGHSNYFPELAHNEIEAVTGDGFQKILLYDRKTKVIERANRFMKPIEIKLKGKSDVAKIFYGTYFGFMLSYYLAKIEGIDYKSIDKIEGLK